MTDNRTNEQIVADALRQVSTIGWHSRSAGVIEAVNALSNAGRLVTAQGAAPQAEPDKPADLSIMNGWLVESVSRHTCGAGMDGYGHEPGCGYVPVLNLAELDGYPKQTAEAVERVSALHRMVLRGNSMRGEELKSWCEHCDTAYPCETMRAIEIELDCECYGADGVTDQKCNACAAPVLPSSTTPQAEAYDHCCQHPKCPGGSLCCCVSEQRLRDCWNQWREEVAGDTKQAFRDAYSAGRNDPAPWAAAPALPSSGVKVQQ